MYACLCKAVQGVQAGVQGVQEVQAKVQADFSITYTA